LYRAQFAVEIHRCCDLTLAGDKQVKSTGYRSVDC
jgi:hypothetical protein